MRIRVCGRCAGIATCILGSTLVVRGAQQPAAGRGAPLPAVGQPAACLAVTTTDFVAAKEMSPTVGSALRSRGFSEAEITAAVQWAVTEIRCGPEPLPASQPIPRERLIDKAQSMGRLIIESSPPGASITVDGRPWGGGTNTAGFADAGMRRIRVATSSGSIAEATCEVFKDARSRFYAELNREKNTATCGRVP
jgi:hypothetical protein